MPGTRKGRVPMKEQHRLINEYRQIGMPDDDWCRVNDIVSILADFEPMKSRFWKSGNQMSKK